MDDNCSKCKDPGTIALVCKECGDRVCSECLTDEELRTLTCGSCLDTTHAGRARRQSRRRRY
jgi:hypothetical protein